MNSIVARRPRITDTTNMIKYIENNEEQRTTFEIVKYLYLRYLLVKNMGGRKE